MTDSNQSPKLPWWVSYHTDPTTTRSTLRQDAWLYFLIAAIFLGLGLYDLIWQPAWRFVLVRPTALIIFPAGFTLLGLWTLVAVRWLDRHQAWDQLTTEQERETYEKIQSQSRRSLSLGFLLLVIGGGVGAFVGSRWKAEIGITLGVASGAVGGFILGSVIAGIRDGIRSKSEKPVTGNSQSTEPKATTDEPLE